VLVSVSPVELDPFDELMAAWTAEEDALERGDIEVLAVLEAWTLPGTPEALRARVGAMQRRAFATALAADEPPEAPDPLEDDPELLAAIDVPVLVAVGERDMIDFRRGAETLAHALPRARHEVIAGAGHLARLETPDAFRALLFAFLAEADAT
jgi:3-oxoadipate enol-lactonase